MRKIILSNLITLDGYFEGPNREIDWHNVDAEFNEYAIELLNSIDTIIFGRTTYEMMAAYWPTPDAINDDPTVAEKMNSLPKIVISKNLKKADWNNTRLISDNVTEEIAKIKQAEGKDIAIFGSSNLSTNLMPHGLIDEYRIIINPVILGNGKPIFNGLNDRLNLKLTGTKVFNNGNVMLYYEPKIIM